MSTRDEKQAQVAGITETEIADRAYELWLRRGCPTGSPEEDWFKARQEMEASRSLRIAELTVAMRRGPLLHG